MGMVLPAVLSAEQVVDMPDYVLNLITEVSTGIITSRINAFIDNNIESSNTVDREAAIKLKRAYAYMNELEEYLNSPEAKALSDDVKNLMLIDVTATRHIDDLKADRDKIIELLRDEDILDDKFKNSLGESQAKFKKTAYTKKLDKDNYESTISELEAMLEQNPQDEKAINDAIKMVKKNPTLFKNGRYEENSPTVFRSVIYRKDRLYTILKGLDFLIPRLEAGQSPSDWRRL